VIPLSEPAFKGNERAYLQECLDSGYISSSGPFVQRFEQAFAAAVARDNAVACASGTSALHVALRVAGAGPGSLVAVSDFTFIASANAISYTGADLWLVDSEPVTWNMNTQLLYDDVVRRARTGRPMPDIVEVVHVLGHPADMEPVLALREQFGIRIIEDAAESLGASWRGGPLAGSQVGAAADIGCFSFNGNKIITSGGGGMIATDDAELANRARHLVNQAKIGNAYVHDEVGYNYRMTSLCAAVGLAQLEELSAVLEAKRRIAHHYDEAFRDSSIQLPPRVPWAESSYWLYSVLLQDAAPAPEIVAEAIGMRGIDSRRLWPPLHRQKPYAAVARIGGEIGERIFARGLSLPSSPGLSEQDQATVVAAVRAAIG
jgi:dTDP-4-amino-4,6-dideoxygalactose transaminase